MFRSKTKDGITRLEGNKPLSIADVIGLIHPINSVIITVDNVNPGTRLTGTTWVSWGMGRTIMGIGTVEANTSNAQGAVTAGQYSTSGAESKFGEIGHTLTQAEMEHYHWTGVSYDGSSIMVSKFDQGIAAASTIATKLRAVITGPTNATASARYDSTSYVDATPGRNAHNIVQPSIACYMWKRTA